MSGAPNSYFVDGLPAVREYARFKPEAILSVEAVTKERQAVERVLKEHGVTVKVQELRRDPKKPQPQDASPVRAVVKVAALDDLEFTRRLEIRAAGNERDLIIALDHITDPRNLGAIVRSAAFFGVREVVAPERRQVLFTQASVATAQGGFALTDLVCVVNLGRALDELKERGYWIVGTAMDGEPLMKIAARRYDKIVLVLGAEDVGMALKVRERCDLLASIPGAHAHGKGLDSLNVSVAAGICLAALAPAADAAP